MRTVQSNLFINAHEHSGVLKKLKTLFADKADARWIVVTRSEYIRLQAMQGILLVLVLGLTGVMLG